MPEGDQIEALHRRRAWRISLALFACFGSATAAMHTVLAEFEWWFSIAGTVGVVLGAAALTRALSARRWLPTVVAVLALAGIITLFFARSTAFFYLVPTRESLRGLAALAQEGGVSIAGQSIPAEATSGIVFLLCVGIGTLAVVADVIAVTWRRPVLAGVPIAVVLSIPTIIGTHLADVFIFVIAAVCWLVLLRVVDPLRQSARAFGIGALVVVVSLIAPLLLPQVEEPQTSGDGFGGYLASINPVLALGDELRRGLPRTILVYNTVSGDPAYLRLVSLQNFQPETWEPDPPVFDLDNVPSRVGPAPGLAAEVAVDDESTWIDVDNLGSPWLPVPYPAVEVNGLHGDWYWSADDLSFASPDRVANGEVYRVSSLRVQPTPAQLEAASGVDTGSSYDKYRELPADLPAIIGEKAREVTAEATSDYARAVALQEYFRHGPFTYSEVAPIAQGYDSSGMTAIAQFLSFQSGYCVHFASAMAVMARTLNIPSRVVVGFLPGREQSATVQGRTAYRVSTRDVHSWPELYFEGIGWTRFEPTPGRGFVPSYADEATPGVPISPNSRPAPTASPPPTGAPANPDELRASGDPGAIADAARTSLGWLIAGLVLLFIVMVLLIPAGVRVGQRIVRMRRLERGYPAATTVWKELLQSVDDLGVDISDTLTPREAASVIEQVAPLGETELAVLASLLALVERQSFAGETPRHTVDRYEGANSINGILRRLRLARGWRARVLAALAPHSIWSRILNNSE